MKKRDWARKKVEAHVQGQGDHKFFYPVQVENLLRAERARARRVVNTQRKFYLQQHAEWLGKVGNRPLVQCFKAKADACDELLRRLG